MKFDDLYESIMSDKEAMAFNNYKHHLTMQGLKKNPELHSEFPISPKEHSNIASPFFRLKRKIAMNRARNRAAWEKNPVPPGTINKRPPPPFPDTRAKKEAEVIRKHLGSPI